VDAGHQRAGGEAAVDRRGGLGGGAVPTCSGIAQSTWEFTRIFQGFSG
jgi:hypothetical protein